MHVGLGTSRKSTAEQVLGAGLISALNMLVGSGDLREGWETQQHPWLPAPPAGLRLQRERISQPVTPPCFPAVLPPLTTVPYPTWLLGRVSAVPLRRDSPWWPQPLCLKACYLTH